MLEGDRRALVSRNVQVAAHLDANVRALVRQLQSMKSGLRSGGGGISSKGGHSDPTFNAATADTGTDPAQVALDRFDQIAREVNKLLEEANGIRLRWLEPELFTALHRNEGCENCALYGEYEAVLSTGDVAGRLKDRKGQPVTKALGRWCWEFAAKTDGVLPVDWQVEAHHAGKRVKTEAALPAEKTEPTVHALDVTVRTIPPNHGRTDVLRNVHQALAGAGLDVDVKERKKRKGATTPPTARARLAELEASADAGAEPIGQPA